MRNRAEWSLIENWKFNFTLFGPGFTPSIFGTPSARIRPNHKLTPLHQKPKKEEERLHQASDRPTPLSPGTSPCNRRSTPRRGKMRSCLLMRNYFTWKPINIDLWQTNWDDIRWRIIYCCLHVCDNYFAYFFLYIAIAIPIEVIFGKPFSVCWGVACIRYA